MPPRPPTLQHPSGAHDAGMDIMTGARLGRAILVSGARESAAASLPRRAATASAVKRFNGVLLSRAPPAAASQQPLHALASNNSPAPAGDGRCGRNRRLVTFSSSLVAIAFVSFRGVYVGKRFRNETTKRVIYLCRGHHTRKWPVVGCFPGLLQLDEIERTTASHCTYRPSPSPWHVLLARAP